MYGGAESGGLEDCALVSWEGHCLGLVVGVDVMRMLMVIECVRQKTDVNCSEICV